MSTPLNRIQELYEDDYTDFEDSTRSAQEGNIQGQVPVRTRRQSAPSDIVLSTVEETLLNLLDKIEYLIGKFGCGGVSESSTFTSDIFELSSIISEAAKELESNPETIINNNLIKFLNGNLDFPGFADKCGIEAIGLLLDKIEKALEMCKIFKEPKKIKKLRYKISRSPPTRKAVTCYTLSLNEIDPTDVSNVLNTILDLSDNGEYTLANEIADTIIKNSRNPELYFYNKPNKELKSEVIENSDSDATVGGKADKIKLEAKLNIISGII